MTVYKKITFGAFTLDTADETLHRGREKIHLRPKTFALLRNLAAHPGRLITKEELMSRIWADCNVGDEALKHCIREIRKGLGDSAGMPRFIETVHRRGYRFVGRPEPKLQRKAKKTSATKTVDSGLVSDADSFVGRQSELEQLQNLFEKAAEGARQVALVSGNQGVGKTRLIDEFLGRLQSAGPSTHCSGKIPRQYIAWGHCVPVHGKVEAYMPLMEALSGLSRLPNNRQIANILCRHAPLWISQLPFRLSTAQMLQIRISTRYATHARMLRELAEVLEEMTYSVPMVLVLEDIHWSDSDTMDWLLYWAKRRSFSRLLTIATCRSLEANAEHTPFSEVMRELQSLQSCLKLHLPVLRQSGIKDPCR